MIILSPVALFFLASFLLTIRWYVRVGSIPALFLGAIVQPLFTATLFAAGLHLAGQQLSGAASGTFKSALLVSLLFTLVIATPLSLFACIGPMRRIRLHAPSQASNAQDDGFVILLTAGFISLICAVLAVATVFVAAAR